MAANSLVSTGFGWRVLLRHHSRRALRAGAALALTVVGSLWPSSAHAEWAAQRDADQGVHKTPATPAKIELLARAGYGQLSVGMLQVGVEGTYMLTPQLGFGAAVDAFYVDNGADPYYSEPGTLSRGYHGLAFVEGDLLKGWVTPYARLGLGAGNYTRFQHYSTAEQLDLVGQAAAGIALRGGPIVGRVWAAPSLYGKDFVMLYGAGIGVRF